MNSVEFDEEDKMRVTVVRGDTEIGVTQWPMDPFILMGGAMPSFGVVKGRYAIISTPYGHQLILKGNGWNDFVIVAAGGFQFERQEIIEIFNEIAAAQVEPEVSMICVYRCKPNPNQLKHPEVEDQDSLM